MKKLLFVFLTLGTLIFSVSCSNTKLNSKISDDSNYLVVSNNQYSLINDEIEIKDNDEFGFKIRYGVEGRKAINTFNNTYTKDLVTKGVAITHLAFTKEEMDNILEKMIQINIFDYPSNFDPSKYDNKIVFITPSDTYYIKVKYNGIIKEILWNRNNASQIEEAKNLRNLIKEIDSLIQTKEEYKTLPESEGGYD